MYRRLDKVDDIKDILKCGGGYFNIRTKSYILYSRSVGQGLVIDIKNGEIITVLRKGPPMAHWQTVGRGVFGKALGKWK